MRNLKKYSNHSGYSADERALGYNVSICKNESHTHYDKPYDSKIAYIETDGTQWINTGISFKDVKTFSMSITITPTRLYNYNHIFCVGGTNQEAWITTQGWIYYRWNGILSSSLKTLLQDDNINVRMEFDGINHTCDYYVDGSITLSQSNNAFVPLTITDSLFLLKRDTFSELKFYDFKLIQDGNLVLDLIPVRVGQVGYIYDRVSKRLFGNAGTGEFVLGPDV